MRKISDIKTKFLVLLLILIECVVMRILNITCFIKALTGIACPFCGTTRALICILKLRFSDALGFHPMIWCLPILFGYFIYDGKLFKNKAVNITVICALGLGYLAVWILRFVNVIPAV